MYTYHLSFKDEIEKNLRIILDTHNLQKIIALKKAGSLFLMLFKGFLLKVFMVYGISVACGY